MSHGERRALEIVDHMWGNRYGLVFPDEPEYDDTMMDPPGHRHIAPVAVDLGDLAELRALLMELVHDV